MIMILEEDIWLISYIFFGKIKPPGVLMNSHGKGEE
jgi:hypothetical protein